MIFTKYNDAICEIAQALANGYFHAPLSPVFNAEHKFLCLKLTVVIAGQDFEVVMGDPEPVWNDETEVGFWEYEAAIRLCEPFNADGFGRTWDFTTPAELVAKATEMAAKLPA